MHKIPESKSAGGIIFNETNDVLLVQEFGEYWGLPRGHLEEGEDALQAARREIFEETGITDLTKIADLGSYTRSTFDQTGKPNYRELKHITVFAFTTTQTKLQPRDKAITAAGWFDPVEAESMFINDEDLTFFVDAMKTTKAILG